MTKIILALLVFTVTACNSKKDRSQCKKYTDEAYLHFNEFLNKKKRSELELADKTLKISFRCDPTSHLNNWLKVKILVAREKYDSALIALNEFERHAGGPSIKLAKAELFEKLNLKDSSMVNCKLALSGFEEMIPKEPENLSNVLLSLQIILRLEGEQKVREKLAMYKKNYGNMPQLKSLDDAVLKVIKGDSLQNSTN